MTVESCSPQDVLMSQLQLYGWWCYLQPASASTLALSASALLPLRQCQYQYATVYRLNTFCLLSPLFPSYPKKIATLLKARVTVLYEYVCDISGLSVLDVEASTLSRSQGKQAGLLLSRTVPFARGYKYLAMQYKFSVRITQSNLEVCSL